MSLRLAHRHKLLIPALLHPHYREIVKTYVAPHDTEIIELPYGDGLVDSSKPKELISDEFVSVIVQNPNLFGGIENLAKICEIVHSKNALLINVIADSMSLGVLKAPGEMKADIVAGEAQSSGMNLNYGGPYNSYLAAKRQFLRQLPERIAGETVDMDSISVFSS
jgi:glycine dehydrogenase subunit 1